MPNEKSLWKPGQSGNPHGRPKAEWTWAGVIKQVVDELNPKTNNEFKRDMVKALVTEVIRGNSQAAKILMDRTDGLPSQEIKQSGNLTFTVVRGEEKPEELTEVEETPVIEGVDPELPKGE